MNPLEVSGQFTLSLPEEKDIPTLARHMKERASRCFLSFNLFLVAASFCYSDFQTDFKPPWGCQGAHCQTILGGFFPPKTEVAFIRKRFEIPDGDFLQVDFLPTKKSKTSVVILPGPGRSSEALYILTLLRWPAHCKQPSQ